MKEVKEQMHHGQPTYELQIMMSMYLCLYCEATKTDQKFQDHKHCSVIDSACNKTKAIAHLKLMLKQLLIVNWDEIDDKLGVTTFRKCTKFIFISTLQQW